jgi:hypothetical protein
MPTTEIRVHVPGEYCNSIRVEVLNVLQGWTVFDNLYLFNGTLFIVTDEPQQVPDRMLITSSGVALSNGPADVASRTPTDEDMQIISSAKAAEIFGSYASRMDGTSVSQVSHFSGNVINQSFFQFIVNDPPQLWVNDVITMNSWLKVFSINHYYHWAAEVFFGLWRAYSILDPGITSDGRTKLSAPRRILMSHVPNDKWRDYAAMNQLVTRGAFPSASVEFEEDWADRASMAHPFLLERAVLTDRAASTHSPNAVMTQRSNAELFKLPGSPYWWSTIRNNLIEFAGADSQAPDSKVITYVSRQEWGRRMLLSQDHDRLVKALEGLREQYGYEVNIVSMDKLTRQEQFRLAGRTSVSTSQFHCVNWLWNELDLDGCAWQWSYLLAVDEAFKKGDCHGVFLSGRFCTWLWMDYARPRHETLRLLGQWVC